MCCSEGNSQNRLIVAEPGEDSKDGHGDVDGDGVKREGFDGGGEESKHGLDWSDGEGDSKMGKDDDAEMEADGKAEKDERKAKSKSQGKDRDKEKKQKEAEILSQLSPKPLLGWWSARPVPLRVVVNYVDGRELPEPGSSVRITMIGEHKLTQSEEIRFKVVENKVGVRVLQFNSDVDGRNLECASLSDATSKAAQETKSGRFHAIHSYVPASTCGLQRKVDADWHSLETPVVAEKATTLEERVIEVNVVKDATTGEIRLVLTVPAHIAQLVAALQKNHKQELTHKRPVCHAVFIPSRVCRLCLARVDILHSNATNGPT